MQHMGWCQGLDLQPPACKVRGEPLSEFLGPLVFVSELNPSDCQLGVRSHSQECLGTVVLGSSLGLIKTVPSPPTTLTAPPPIFFFFGPNLVVLRVIPGTLLKNDPWWC